jgi:hypothetical protein
MGGIMGGTGYYAGTYNPYHHPHHHSVAEAAYWQQQHPHPGLPNVQIVVAGASRRRKRAGRKVQKKKKNKDKREAAAAAVAAATATATPRDMDKLRAAFSDDLESSDDDKHSKTARMIHCILTLHPYLSITHNCLSIFTGTLNHSTTDDSITFSVPEENQSPLPKRRSVEVGVDVDDNEDHIREITSATTAKTTTPRRWLI